MLDNHVVSSPAERHNKPLFFYWLPKRSRGAPDQVILTLWSGLQRIAPAVGLKLHPFHNVRDLLRLLRSHGRPDLVYFGKMPVPSISPRSRAFVVALMSGLPVGTHAHGDIRHELQLLWRSNPLRALAAWPFHSLCPYLLPLHHVVVVNSRDMARRTQVVGLPESKIHVMPNPVDVTFWTSSPSEEQTFLKFPSIPYIFSHGRLATEKGYDLLIEGVARSGHNKRIVLAGEGPARTRLGELARHHGVPVEFLGWQSAIQLRTLLRRAEVAIYPSRYEPFSLAALEALLAAPHVLVSNRAGVLDFLPEDIVRRVSFEPAVDAIADALRRSNPPCLRPYPSLMIFGPEHVARTFVDSILRPVIHAM